MKTGESLGMLTAVATKVVCAKFNERLPQNIES